MNNNINGTWIRTGDAETLRRVPEAQETRAGAGSGREYVLPFSGCKLGSQRVPGKGWGSHRGGWGPWELESCACLPVSAGIFQDITAAVATLVLSVALHPGCGRV